MDQYFISSYCSITSHCMDRLHLIYPVIYWWTLGCSHFLAILSSAAMNILWTYVFISLRYIPRSEIAGSCGNSTYNVQGPVFQNHWTILHSHQQCKRVPISPHPVRSLLLICLIRVTLVNVRWYLIVVLDCISMMAIDAKHLFMCFLTISTPSLEKWLFRYIAHL